MHYPTDVLAGALLAVCWLTVTSRCCLPTGGSAGGPPVSVEVAVVVNPAKVSDPDELRRQIAERSSAETGWWETTEQDPGAGQAAAAVAAGAKLVLVCGGDGTVAACAGALADTGVAMALLPDGTGNLLARNLGIPLEPSERAGPRLRPASSGSWTCWTPVTGGSW